MRNTKTAGNVTALHTLPNLAAEQPHPSLANAGAAAPASVVVAEDALADAVAAVRVAQARLREAEASAPRTGPRLAAAEATAAGARQAAQRRSQGVAARRRAVDDAEGAVDAAAAAEDDLTNGHRSGTPGAQVAARVKVEKADRALHAARVALVDAEEARAQAEAELTAAEAELEHVRQEPPETASSVLAAQATLERAERACARAEEALASARRDADRAGDRPGAPIVTEFASLDAFIEHYVLPNWRHRLTQGRWCPTWWRHSEAIARLEAVWEAFEVMRLEPAPSMSTWWRDHLDVHMRALTAEDGTFAGCAASGHEPAVHKQQDLWLADEAEPGQFHTDPDSPRQPTRITRPHSEGASA